MMTLIMTKDSVETPLSPNKQICFSLHCVMTASISLGYCAMPYMRI
ncbi:hypothetical protein [Shewanella sp. 0m-4]